MNESKYTNEERLTLYLAGELTGAELSAFETDLANDQELMALAKSISSIDEFMISSLKDKDLMPDEFRQKINAKINQLHLEKSPRIGIFDSIRQLLTPKSLIPAGTGAAMTALFFSMLGGPVLVMKGSDKRQDKYTFEVENNGNDIQEMPWMLQQPALTKIIVNDKAGNYSRYLGNSANKAEVGESFFVYVTLFKAGELSVKRVSDDGSITPLFDRASVSIGSVIEVSDEGYPWELKRRGIEKIEVFINKELADTILLQVE